MRLRAKVVKYISVPGKIQAHVHPGYAFDCPDDVAMSLIAEGVADRVDGPAGNQPANAGNPGEDQVRRESMTGGAGGRNAAYEALRPGHRAAEKHDAATTPAHTEPGPAANQDAHTEPGPAANQTLGGPGQEGSGQPAPEAQAGGGVKVNPVKVETEDNAAPPSADDPQPVGPGGAVPAVNDNDPTAAAPGETDGGEPEGPPGVG